MTLVILRSWAILPFRRHGRPTMQTGLLFAYRGRFLNSVFHENGKEQDKNKT